MQEFNLTLKNEKSRLYNQISWIIIFIHILVFIYLALFFKNKYVQSGCIAALAMMVFCFLLRYYLLKKKSSWNPEFHIFYTFLWIAWISIGWYWLVLIPVVFDALMTIATRKLITKLSEKEIHYPSFPSKVFSWRELNNVILKDGLLTIDLKNNKLIQQFIDEKNTIINEIEFNDFCNEQLSKSRGLSTPD
jgi:hypothetical protein